MAALSRQEIILGDMVIRQPVTYLALMFISSEGMLLVLQ